MKITQELDLWSMCNRQMFWPLENLVYLTTIEEKNTLQGIIEDCWPNGIDLTDLNDLFRFDTETWLEWIGKTEEELLSRPF